MVQPFLLIIGQRTDHELEAFDTETGCPAADEVGEMKVGEDHHFSDAAIKCFQVLKFAIRRRQTYGIFFFAALQSAII